jgi:soluble lytic murein transglycosylase-like protein
MCSALAMAAAQNDLPTDFFALLIWQESRFDPAAVSRAGAQGVAQFMPATANWRGLSNPFGPLEAIAQSANPPGAQHELLARECRMNEGPRLDVAALVVLR